MIWGESGWSSGKFKSGIEKPGFVFYELVLERVKCWGWNGLKVNKYNCR